MLTRVAIAAMIAVLIGTAGQPASAKGHKSHGSDQPATATVQAQHPPQKGMVWANTKSKVYHVEGSQHYGKTRNGEWMTEADAKAKGFHAVGEKPAGHKPDNHKPAAPAASASPAH
jgi:hypothetical protein